MIYFTVKQKLNVIFDNYSSRLVSNLTETKETYINFSLRQKKWHICPFDN